MSDITYKYIYPFERERYDYYWNKILPKKDVLRTRTICNAIALPPKKSEKFYGNGCILENNGSCVTESFMYGIDGIVYMGGRYDIKKEKIEHIRETLVYLGFINNHWGHFLVDFTTRLWYALEHPEYKCIFLLSYDIQNFYISRSIIRFLELCNIDIKNVYFIKSVKIIDALIVPEPSYVPSIYYSDAYTKVFSVVSENSKPNKKNPYEKIYFSRQKFDKSLESEIGAELFDNLFSRNNFTIIYPETETLDDQIYYIKNVTQFAGISGSVIHNLLFSEGLERLIIINKTFHINTLIFDLLKIKKIVPIFVDSYAVHHPVRIGSGPFLFVNNYLLHNFIRDFNFTENSDDFLSSDFTEKCVRKYEFMYHKIVYIQKILIDETEDKYNWQYFSYVQ